MWSFIIHTLKQNTPPPPSIYSCKYLIVNIHIHYTIYIVAKVILTFHQYVFKHWSIKYKEKLSSNDLPLGVVEETHYNLEKLWNDLSGHTYLHTVLLDRIKEAFYF